EKMKLWNEKELDKEIEKFTVDKDPQLDLKLVIYDCQASVAHANMLHKIKVITKEELDKLNEGLNEIITLSKEGKFKIDSEEEDCHTAIENFLTSKFGEVGKKIHTARSRNDQVLTALRLYEKEELKEIKKLVESFIEKLNSLIKKYGEIHLPGYTHMQKAMPTNIKTWLGSFLDSMKDNLIQIECCNKLIDQSPLGSAAGFGVPVFKVDKNLTAKEIGFSKVMENPLYCQLSRGKFEGFYINVISQVMFDINKLSTDLILFSMQEFNYISLPEKFCTGSSIMPQKKNPDVLELLRAKYSIVLGEEFKIKSLISNLMSGYNRDLQLTKEPLTNSIEIMKNSLNIITILLDGITINEQNCEKAMTKDIYATEKAYKLVKNGTPFREAYKKVKEELK
ncbi:argininosuccinate lyase, partial [Nanoarchaeota archaeon]